MTIITIQTLVLLSAVFFLGCIAGCWFARRARPAMQDMETAPAKVAAKKPGKTKGSARNKKSR